MTNKTINIRVFRFDSSVDTEPDYKDYKVPFKQKMTAMDALDHIYQNLDSTLAYYDHAACTLGICTRCNGKINGKTGLFCQTFIDGDTTLEPANKANVIKDLVYKKTERK